MNKELYELTEEISDLQKSYKDKKANLQLQMDAISYCLEDNDKKNYLMQISVPKDLAVEIKKKYVTRLQQEIAEIEEEIAKKAELVVKAGATNDKEV